MLTIKGNCKEVLLKVYELVPIKGYLSGTEVTLYDVRLVIDCSDKQHRQLHIIAPELTLKETFEINSLGDAILKFREGKCYVSFDYTLQRLEVTHQLISLINFWSNYFETKALKEAAELHLIEIKCNLYINQTSQIFLKLRSNQIKEIYD